MIMARGTATKPVFLEGVRAFLLIPIVLVHSRIERDSISDVALKAIALTTTDGVRDDSEDDDHDHDSNYGEYSALQRLVLQE